VNQTAYLNRIAEVRRRFLLRLDEPMAALNEALSLPRGKDPMTRMRGILHEWAGTAPTLGLETFGAEARDLESVIANALASGRPLSDTEVEQLRAGFARLAAHADQAREMNR